METKQSNKWNYAKQYLLGDINQNIEFTYGIGLIRDINKDDDIVIQESL